MTAASGGGVTVTGSTTGTPVLSGTLAAINAYLASAASPTYLPVAHENGAVTLTMTTSDNGNTGAGGPLTDVDTSTINIAPVNDAAIDLVFTYTGTNGNALPNNNEVIGNITATDPDSGGATTYLITNLTATRLTGGVASNFAGDVTIDSAGVIRGNLDEGRVYEVTIEAKQGSNTYAETFSVITGTNAGADSIGGTAANGDDVIFARGQGDTVLAGSGNDYVFGQQGDDWILGGTGNDVLNGSAGDDRFYFDTALDSVQNFDIIQDFNGQGNDTFYLDDAIFSSLANGAGGTLSATQLNLTGAAVGAGPQIIYNPTTGALYYDDDGVGGHASIHFATITPGTIINTTDFIIF